MKKYFIAANIILLAASAYFGVAAVYKGMESRLPRIQALPDPAPKPVKKPRREKSFSHYKTIAARNLFDTDKKNPAPIQKIDIESLEKTRLDLKLLGTIVGGPENSAAVIAKSSRRKQRLYRIGDSVENAVIKMILWERIVLSVDGREEILEMEKKGAQKIAAASAGTRKKRGRAKKQRPPIKRRITLRRSVIEKSLTDISGLMKDIRVRPHLENGRPAGMALSRVRPSSIFRKMGLAGGDILTGVNGKRIQSAGDAMRLYQGLKNDRSISVDIIRRGRKHIIDYSFK
ncbi:conserved hypothetical protein [Candidatus Desulfarcum epimagneticum]|uniref:Type II secretion system protein GspC N-terminal domain-containing protein n=1 Tax=uncultured Desulfobacteraceae bacterium TaxID=218296 RepID=A0A484HBA4_9BACT|nr:conserved hypothetical protein [uncultured Desulfobacteraceae bacterium]